MNRKAFSNPLSKHRRLLLLAGITCAGVCGLAHAQTASQAGVAQLASAVVAPSAAGAREGFDAVVEALRQSVVAAQVTGAVVSIEVKPGDAVRPGQVLLRLDAHAADQNAAASDAQVQSARAALEVATQEVERQRQLFGKSYISQAALERAEALFKATQAQVSAQLAQAGAAHTQTGFYVVRSPYAGVVAEVPVAAGDMAMPGRALVSLYDPSALRVTANVPQAVLASVRAGTDLKVEIPGVNSAASWLDPVHVQVLPTADAATHTVQIRLDLARGTPGLAPGMFARAWIPAAPGGAQRIVISPAAIVRRGEMTGVYVLDTSGRALLRQVRLGRAGADGVEILSGLDAGERVALEPQAAARVR